MRLDGIFDILLREGPGNIATIDLVLGLRGRYSKLQSHTRLCEVLNDQETSDDLVAWEMQMTHLGFRKFC